MSVLTSSVFGDSPTNGFRINGFAYDGGRYWEPPVEVLPHYPREEDSEDPPDGGRLAWLHAFMGFFVIMNAQ